MNKDAKLLAEAYDEIKFTRTFKEMPGRLNPTAEAEKIAEFLNSNEVYSGAPVKGAGGWVASEGAVYNNDAEGGQRLSVKIVPEKRGLIVHHKMSNGGIRKTLYSWPVEARHLNQQLQTY